MRTNGTRRRRRRGAAAIEFALVAPLFLLFIFAMIEFGRMMMVQQVLIQASRDGARHAIVNGATVEDTRELIQQQLSELNIEVVIGKSARARESGDA